MRPVLEAKGTSRTVPAGDGIETWAKAHDGWWTVIAVNSTQKPLSATIDLSTLTTSNSARTLFEEGRVCSLEGGVITDTFTAEGVHLYRVPVVDRED